MPKLSPITVGLVIAVVGLSGIIIYMYIRRSSEKVEATSPSAAGPPPPQNPEEPCFVLFHSNGCGHCTHMKNDWKKTVENLRGRVKTVDVEGSDPEMRNHQMQGVPTIRFFPRGLAAAREYIEYKGPREEQEMTEFALSGGRGSAN